LNAGSGLDREISKIVNPEFGRGQRPGSCRLYEDAHTRCASAHERATAVGDVTRVGVDRDHARKGHIQKRPIRDAADDTALICDGRPPE
jgi:hypothetical protein